MSIAYMHIGVPKTGTSTIQRFLVKNRELLQEKGYLYPDFGISYPGVGSARNAYFISQTGKPHNQEECRASYAALGKLANRAEKIILSDEAIWNRQKPPGFWTKVREQFDRIGMGYHVIVYLRRQDTLVEAFWNQRVKGKGKMTMSFEEFLEERYKFMPMAYDEWLDRIIEEGKPEKLTVKVFERRQLKGASVLDDFCDVIGLPITGDLSLPKDSNASFDSDVLAIKRMINGYSSYAKTEDFYYDSTLATYRHDEKGSKSSMFSPERRQAFMDAYEAGNAYVAKKYFGRESGELFFDNTGEIPQWQPDAERELAAAVRVLSGADIMLYNRIKELEKKISKIEELEKKLSNMYESFPARIYRKMRGREKGGNK